MNALAPYPLRVDTAPRAVFPAGIAADPDYGQYTGAHGDPRTPEPTEEEDELNAKREACRDALYFLTSALRLLGLHEEGMATMAEVDEQIQAARKELNDVAEVWLPGATQ